MKEPNQPDLGDPEMNMRYLLTRVLMSDRGCLPQPLVDDIVAELQRGNQ